MRTHSDAGSISEDSDQPGPINRAKAGGPKRGWECGLKSSPALEAEFAAIRRTVAFLERDRYLATDIEAMRQWAHRAELPAVLLNILPSHA